MCVCCIRDYMSSEMAGWWAARGRPKRLLTARECLELEPALASLEEGDNRDLVGGVLCQEGASDLHNSLSALN